jgi:hypothetical protein
MGNAARGHIGLAKETDWGTPEAATKYLPFVSETLSRAIEQLVSAAQKGIIDEPASYPGSKTIAGDIVLEVDPVSIGHLLRSAFDEPISGAYDTGPEAYQHEFEPRQDDFSAVSPLCPYTLEVYRDIGDAFQYAGGVVNTLNLSFGVDEKILRATVGIIAKDYAGITKTSPSFATENPFTWDQALIKIATVQNNDLESFNFTLNNQLLGVPTLNNTALISRIYRNAFRTVEVAITVDFVDQAQYDIFEAQTEQAFEITLEGAEIESGHNYSLIIDIPKLRYTAYPINLSGASRITSAVTGKAKYDSVSGYAIKITLINKETEY